jgi:hypothetical protein
MRSTVLLFASLAAAAVPVLAQPAARVAWPPAAGARARIVSPVFGGDKRVGVIESVKGDTLQFRRAEGVQSLTPGQITMIEIPTSTHTEKAKWISIGLLTGALAGGAVGAASYSSSCRTALQCNIDDGGLDAIGRSASAFGGGLIGAVSGALLGAWWGNKARESWTSMALPPR